MNPNRFAAVSRAEQILHRGLEQNGILLQPRCCVVVILASAIHQFPGKELCDPGALGTKSLQ